MAKVPESAATLYRHLEALYKETDPNVAEQVHAERRKLLLQRQMAIAVAQYLSRLTSAYGDFRPYILSAKTLWSGKVAKSFRRQRAQDRELNEAIASLLRRKSWEAALNTENVDRIVAVVMSEAMRATVDTVRSHTVLSKAEDDDLDFLPVFRWFAHWPGLPLPVIPGIIFVDFQGWRLRRDGLRDLRYKNPLSIYQRNVVVVDFGRMPTGGGVILRTSDRRDIPAMVFEESEEWRRARSPTQDRGKRTSTQRPAQERGRRTRAAQERGVPPTIPAPPLGPGKRPGGKGPYFAREAHAYLYEQTRAIIARYLRGAAGNHAYDVANIIVNATNPARPKTIAEVSRLIRQALPGLNAARTDMIARTETARAYGIAAQRTLLENGVQRVRWVTAQFSPAARTVPVCDICTKNASQGWIPNGTEFQSGHVHAPAHPRCRCAVIGDYVNWSPPTDTWPRSDIERRVRPDDD